MAITLILLGSLLLGLILLAAGAILFFTLKNKLPGILVLAAGLVISVLTVAVFSFLMISSSIQG